MRTDANGLPIKLTELSSSYGRQLPCPASRKTDVNAADLVHVAFSPQFGLRLRLLSH